MSEVRIIFPNFFQPCSFLVYCNLRNFFIFNSYFAISLLRILCLVTSDSLTLLNPLRVSKHISPRSKCAIGFCRVLVTPGDPISSCFPSSLTSDSTCQLLSSIVNGRWSGWTSWSPCSVTCGNGRQERMRKCDSPVPEYGGKFCDGPAREFHNCEEDDCPGNCSNMSTGVSILCYCFTYITYSKFSSHVHKEVELNKTNIKF